MDDSLECRCRGPVGIQPRQFYLVLARSPTIIFPMPRPSWHALMRACLPAPNSSLVHGASAGGSRSTESEWGELGGFREVR
eukprot:scaffold8896_cov95-Isochrysis_galbana.AAC.2